MARPVLVALLIILPLTLGVRSIRGGERLPDQDRLAADAAVILAADGWSVQPPQWHLIGHRLNGSRGRCRILVQFPSPTGQSHEWLAILARPIGPVTYQYRGAMSSEPPRFAPTLAQHAQRYAGSFGVEIANAPLIATALSPSCNREAPDFTGLRQHLLAARGTA